MDRYDWMPLDSNGFLLVMIGPASGNYIMALTEE